MQQHSSKIRATGWLPAAVLLATCCVSGCAVSEKPPNNGQSHWLQSCDDDADCPELRCICGVCSLECESDDACTSASSFSCGTGALLADSNRCDDAPAETRLCLPAAFVPTADASTDEQRDADQVPDAESIGDASTAHAGDADTGTVEPPPLDIEPFHVECDAINGGTLPEGVELFASSSVEIGSITFSGNAMSWSEGYDTHYRASPTDDIQTFTLQSMPVLDGPEIFFAVGKSIAKVTIDSGEVVNLGAATSGTISGPTLDESSVYWVASASLTTGTNRLMRSDRDPGDTVRVASITGSGLQIVDTIGDYVFVGIRDYATSDQAWQLARIAKSGSTEIETIGEQHELKRVISNGTDLFTFISTSSGTPGMPPGDNRILRVDRTDGTLHTLFDTQRVEQRAFAADDGWVYWVANTSFSTIEQALWAGRNDGLGEPIMLAEGWTEQSIGVAVDATSFYLTIACSDNSGSESRVLRIGKPE